MFKITTAGLHLVYLISSETLQGIPVAHKHDNNKTRIPAMLWKNDTFYYKLSVESYL